MKQHDQRQDGCASQRNPLLTLAFMTTAPENKYFDRKSARIKPSDLAALVAGFANAEGGTVAIGISDKTHRIEGVNAIGADKLNALLNVAKDFCKPMPVLNEEFLPVVNDAGEDDRVLLLHVEASVDELIFLKSDDVYLHATCTSPAC